MRSKRIPAFLLAAAFLVSLLSGCGGSPAEENDTVSAPAPASEPAAEPTATPAAAEQPALPGTLQQVCDLGIADEKTLLRADSVCTRQQAAAMLAQVHKLRCGTDSRYLNDPAVAGSSSAATRYYFAQALYFSAMESFYDAPYESWDAWAGYCEANEQPYIWPDSILLGPDMSGVVDGGDIWNHCWDLDEIQHPANADGLRNWLDFGFIPAANYALLVYDRTDGTKVLSLDEDGNFRPYETMTVAQVAEAALRYYNSFEPAAQMVPYEDTAAFDPAIITPELLAKQTTLPDASCALLPAEWHGVLMYDMGRVTNQSTDWSLDKQIYAYEIQAVKDAGFNFIGLAFDFSVLQGPEPEEGKLNETRLKELDQVIAWCIERDIHVDLRCAGLGGFKRSDSFDDWWNWNDAGVNDTGYAGEFAALWKALAQRYAGIPNRYLSFNLFIEPLCHSDEQYAAFFGPAVSAIREASPERCIIADIHSNNLTGRSIAEMGVALSFHAYDPRTFCALNPENQNDAAYLDSAAWPYTAADGKTYNADAVLDYSTPERPSANELAALAEEYGVGFMIGEWGVFCNGIPSNRYPDETLYAFYKDMTDTMAEKGYGWCNGVWYGSLGIAVDYPVITETTYEQVGDHPCYIDQTMLKWFQEFNS